MTTPARILVVDDEVPMLRLIQRILTGPPPAAATKNAVVATPNSLEVPDLLAKQIFQVVVADLRMPGLDGLKILEMVRERNLPAEVILITAFPSMESMQEAIRLQVFEFIVKPFRREQFSSAVERALAAARRRAAAARLYEALEKPVYPEAARLFRDEYARNRLARGDDPDLIAAACGLSPTEMATVLQNP